MAIEFLDPKVIDQIAAGEVVERPAHMVKELLENSLDAHANEIEIEVEHGGRQVLVKDNGIGIEPQDLPKALGRHATSKISTAQDLWSLNTFGFRGEALASISSVSSLTITSRRVEDRDAHRLNMEFGQLNDLNTVGREPGTTVQIERLFENTPARLKFLKTDQSELNQIKQVVKAISLSNPYLTMRLRSNGKMLFFWPACNENLDRVKQILEQETLYYSEGIENGVSIKAVFSPPHIVTGNSRQIWIFVNGRWVNDRTLNAAVMESYRSLLMHGEFPYVSLWIDVPTDEVDVNIHPTKSQVKFQNPSHIFKAVVHVLRKELSKAPWLSDILKNSKTVSESFNNLVENNNIPEKEVLAPMEFPNEEFQIRQYNKKNFQMSAPSVEYTNQNRTTKNVVIDSNSVDLNDTKTQSLWGNLQLVGQVGLTYLVCQNDKSVIFVDQHAAHERVLYEKLMKSWGSRRPEIQNYLIPLQVSLSSDQVESLLTVINDLEKIGINLEQLSPERVGITCGPTLLKEKSIVKSIEWLSSELVTQGESFAFEKAVSEMFASMACHSAVRAGQVMSMEEMKSLLIQMDEFSFSSFCPHGRPVFVEYPFLKMERDFGRLG